MRNIFFLIIGLLLTQSCSLQKTNKEGWNSDLEYLSIELPKKHYDLFAAESKDYFLNRIQQIKSSTDQLSDFEITIQLRQLIASMGDAHTKVNLGQLVDKTKTLPLHIFWFSDGFYILQTTKENEEILGHRITSINQTPIEVIIDSLCTMVTVDNQAIIKSAIPEILPLVQVLEYFNFSTESEIRLGLEDINGAKKNYSIKPSLLNKRTRIIVKPKSIPLYLKNERALFINYYQSDDKINYTQYNKCWSKELAIKHDNSKNANRLPSFKDFEEKVLNTLETKPVEKIVFDLRFNRGGNSSQGTAFIEKIAKFTDKNPKKKIFVILGRHTYSSAILNAMDFKRLTKAIFVGEATSGKPNHFGEVKNFVLPYSGIRINYSTKYFKRADKDENTLNPGIMIESDFNDFMNGIDPVYEWIKKQ